MTRIRLLRPADHPAALAIYRDAVLSQTPALYRPDQVAAWAGQAEAAELRQALARGRGLVSCGPSAAGSAAGAVPGPEAFALLDPADRLALLYCRGRSARQGHATALLDRIERWAAALGVERLRTEASQLSRPLLLRRGWQVEAPEEVLFAGVLFLRWRMVKRLDPGKR